MTSTTQTAAPTDTAAHGALPDFIVIGAMRAGTTTLHRYLGMHPEIGVSKEKETDFFVEELSFRRGLDWYRRQFDPRKRLNGEVSPNYTKRDMFPGVPERIHGLLPDCRLIYVVREPVERAVSQFKFVKRYRPDLSFEDKLDDLVKASLYQHQIEAYREVFGDERILIVDFAELMEAPRRALGSIAAFIGAEGDWGELADVNVNSSAELGQIPAWMTQTRHNPVVARVRGMVPKRLADRLRGLVSVSKAPPVTVDAAMRQAIAERVAEDAERLRRYTGRPFADWSV